MSAQTRATRMLTQVRNAGKCHRWVICTTGSPHADEQGHHSYDACEPHDANGGATEDTQTSRMPLVQLGSLVWPDTRMYTPCLMTFRCQPMSTQAEQSAWLQRQPDHGRAAGAHTAYSCYTHARPPSVSFGLRTDDTQHVSLHALVDQAVRSAGVCDPVLRAEHDISNFASTTGHTQSASADALPS